MRRRYKYPLLFLLFGLLVLVRAYEDALFYDPFIVYFQNDYLYTQMPEYKTGELFLNLGYRFFLNSMISLAIVYVAFEKIGYVILSSKLYLLAFFVLGVVYYILLANDFNNGYLLPFYIRRFIIHPLFLLLLLAALYYEKLTDVEPTL
ncbi:exosortase F system-associated membrane protein [Flavicella sediminum]|uniref:exosortase F system-associated membrane protein n=1 Tax=Flavicella sediminum TaxID=2585141 RepID=UPI001124AF9A|nr:exosortase F system-associated protein [Flavicella sediminum]